jgi:DNA processing protein
MGKVLCTGNNEAGSDTDIRDWLILANAKLSGPQIADLVSRFGSTGAVLLAGTGALCSTGISAATADRIMQPDITATEGALKWLQEPQHHILHFASPDYPELLQRISDAPALIYLIGNPAALHLPSLAIVGSRNPTRGGRRNAYDFAAHLGQTGFSILSGLAQGIDTAAHEGALAADGITVAFLGHGIDRIYPAENHALAHRIAERGALISEYPLGSSPRREHFPQRNRLISGCSLGTLVVEAAKRSGSLITARLASEQGREVFAIPGSIHNTLSRGCHQLIRQGAKLVENAADIVSELGPMVEHLSEQLMQNENTAEAEADLSDDRDDDYKLLIEALGHDPATADDIAGKSGLTIDQVSSMLLILELEGKIEPLHGGQYSLLGSDAWHERKRTRRTDVPV